MCSSGRISRRGNSNNKGQNGARTAPPPPKALVMTGTSEEMTSGEMTDTGRRLSWPLDGMVCQEMDRGLEGPFQHATRSHTIWNRVSETRRPPTPPASKRSRSRQVSEQFAGSQLLAPPAHLCQTQMDRLHNGGSWSHLPKLNYPP